MRRSISFKRNVEVDIVNLVKLTPDFVGITGILFSYRTNFQTGYERYNCKWRGRYVIFYPTNSRLCLYRTEQMFSLSLVL